MKNLGTIDRILRITLGGGAALWALWSITVAVGIWLKLADIAIFAIGIDFVVTGIRGYCPLYRLLGLNTLQAKESR